MASIQRILNNESSSKLSRLTKDYKSQMIHYSNLKNSNKQFYTMDPDVILDLADHIEIAGGIQEPVVARKIDVDRYEILGGHKRVAAVRFLVEERGRNDLAFVPVHVVQVNDWMAEYLLISLNDYPDKSEYERMTEVIRLQDILPHIEGGKAKMTRMLRKRISEETGISETRIANYKSIHKNLCPDGMKLFKEGTLGVSAAVELASMEAERQSDLIHQGITALTDIRKYKQIANQKMAHNPEKVETETMESADDAENKIPVVELIGDEKTDEVKQIPDPLVVAYQMYDKAEKRRISTTGLSRMKAQIEVEALDMWIEAKEAAEQKKINQA